MLEETLKKIQPVDVSMAARVQARLDQLAKPRGSLGRLEDLALAYAVAVGKERPDLRRKVLFIFCGDHGVVKEGVSAYPKEVTAQMVYNFLHGGAAISVLARELGIEVAVVDIGVDHEFIRAPGLISRKLKRGTANIARGAAMLRAEAVQGVQIGIELAQEKIDSGAHLLGVGEMGIGNSTVATAVLAALTSVPPETLTGYGTGIDRVVWQHKVSVVRQALSVNQPDPNDPLGVLAGVGGLEIAGIAGVCLGGAACRVPVVIDGFIATAGAWVACALRPAVKEYLIFAHTSAERGHRRALEELGVRPLLDLELRLGEGTGAAIGMGLVQAAVRLLNEMATFAEAGVCEKER
jgi:nicotinate-nucleotide--dimethylbenzimidazole phosphoribosyltransferase